MPDNNLLSEQLTYRGHSSTPTHLHLCCYNAEGVTLREASGMDEVKPLLRPDAVSWIEVHGLQQTDTVRSVCEAFGVDFLTLQDILNVTHRPKIEAHDDYNVVILKFLAHGVDADIYQPRQMSIVQGRNFILTFTEEENGFWNEIHTAIEHNVMKIRQRHTDYLLSVILNSAMTGFMSIITDLEEQLEDLEERLLAGDTDRQPDIVDLQAYRRNFLQIKKCVLPFKEEMRKLLHTDHTLLHPANLPYLNDVNDHLLFVIQTLEGCRDMITALVDICLSNNDRRLNGIMKQLTVVSSVFIPLTFFVGIWGMNFTYMPELGWRYGYLLAWLVMALTAAGMYAYIKKKRWN